MADQTYEVFADDDGVAFRPGHGLRPVQAGYSLFEIGIEPIEVGEQFGAVGSSLVAIFRNRERHDPLIESLKEVLLHAPDVTKVLPKRTHSGSGRPKQILRQKRRDEVTGQSACEPPLASEVRGNVHHGIYNHPVSGSQRPGDVPPVAAAIAGGMRKAVISSTTTRNSMAGWSGATRLMKPFHWRYLARSSTKSGLRPVGVETGTGVPLRPKVLVIASTRVSPSSDWVFANVQRS